MFRGIHAIDRDKPNTANSDITYSIVVSLQLLDFYLCLSVCVDLRCYRNVNKIRERAILIESNCTTQGGNENNSFILSDPIEGILVINKPLDYDNGIREFKIQIQASVRKDCP